LKQIIADIVLQPMPSDEFKQMLKICDLKLHLEEVMNGSIGGQDGYLNLKIKYKVLKDIFNR